MREGARRTGRAQEARAQPPATHTHIRGTPARLARGQPTQTACLATTGDPLRGGKRPLGNITRRGRRERTRLCPSAHSPAARPPRKERRSACGSTSSPPKTHTGPRLSERRVRPGAGGSADMTLKQMCFRAEPGSAICVQSFDDSLNSAIRTTYRISLRSSSLREPRYPLLEVVSVGRPPALLQGAHKQRCGSVRQVKRVCWLVGRPPERQQPETG